VFYMHAVVRTRFFDDYLIAAVAAGCRQVVLLAAGLDTRAFRLSWPQWVRVFELDLPEVLAFKDTVLAGCTAVPGSDRRALTVDLREDWPVALIRAGFDRTAPTAWLAEGLLLYLAADEADRLLTAVSKLSAPGSRLSFEHASTADTALLAQARQLPTMDQYTALWKGGLGEDAPDWLTRHGWQPRFHDFATLAAFYGRPTPGSASGGFITAVRTEEQHAHAL
jgi:methyltransferase (TIGR00027 family)